MVLAIAGIMIAVGSLSLVKYLPDFRLSSATMDVMSAMNKAKSEAVSRCSNATLTIDIPNNSYSVSNASGSVVYSNTLEDVQLHNCSYTANTLTFDELGTLDESQGKDYTVYLKNSQNDYKGIRADLSGKLSVIEP